jgi:hypothetical protein
VVITRLKGLLATSHLYPPRVTVWRVTGQQAGLPGGTPSQLAEFTAAQPLGRQ